MRTVRIVIRGGGTATFFGATEPMFEVSTEVMVGDDDDAKEAGEDAMRFLNEFCAGTVEANT